MLKIGNYQSYPTSVYDYSAAYELMCELESAARQGFWFTVLDLLQEGPIINHRRDAVLCSALECLGTEEICLNFVRAARTQGPLLPHTDHAILKLATERDYLALALEQMKCGNIESFAADESLRIAAAGNRSALVHIFLTSNFCTIEGKNNAALEAAKNGALDSMLELLKANSIYGHYTHPIESYLDHKLGALTECIWSVLIRESSRKNNWDLASVVAMYKPTPLTRDDLDFLAIAAASAGQKDALEDILSKVNLGFYHGCDAYQAAKQNGHDEILPLLAQYSPRKS